MTTQLKSGRPRDGEYASYAIDDIAHVAGEDAVQALITQGERVVSFLARFDDEAIANLRYAPGKWTFKQVIGHMIDDERIFAYRALCLARNEPAALPGFDENAYVAATDFESRDLRSLLAEYEAVRSASVTFFRALTAHEWTRRGIVNGYEASVRGLAFHLAGHELHHLRVLTERYVPLVRG